MDDMMKYKRKVNLNPLNPIYDWNYSKNNGLEPEDFTPFSNKKVWWKGKCGHEWETSIITRTKQGSSCPYCSGNKVLPGFNDIFTTTFWTFSIFFLYWFSALCTTV